MPVAGSTYPEITEPVPVREARPSVPLPSMISIDPDVAPARLKPVDRIVTVPVPHPVTVPVNTSVLFAYRDPSPILEPAPAWTNVPATSPVLTPCSENGTTQAVGDEQIGVPTPAGCCS